MTQPIFVFNTVPRFSLQLQHIKFSANLKWAASCDKDGVDVSVGVDVAAVVGVGVHGQGVNLGVGLGVGLVSVSLVSDRLGSSTQHGLNVKLQLGDYLNARARSKIGKFRRDYAAKNIAFAPAILSVAGKIHPEFLRPVGVGGHADGQVLQSRWGRRGHRE